MNHLVYLKDEGVNAVSPEFARRFATVKAHFFSRNPDLWPQCCSDKHFFD
ncbi:hypothetical protein [Aeromonas sp. QDB07]|nr:hypothetical protein [Aeromonas sp. QDB07]